MPPPASGLPARLVLGPALRAQSDRRLVRLVREGYESAFEEIVRRYRRPLDRFAAGIVGGRSEDVTQDSFRKALEALRHGDSDVELRPWLYRIVRNTALNDLRDRPPAAAELVEDLVGGARSAAAVAEERAEVAALTARMRALPENQRAALVMRELEGMSHEEIAASLGISGGAARQAIARARTAVRSGFGALVPLPVLRALAGGSDGAAEAAAGGVAVGGAAVVGGGIGAGALKVGLATVVVAGSLGAGVAIQHHGINHRPNPPSAAALAPGGSSGDGVGSTPSPVTAEVDDHSSRSGHDSGDDHGGEGPHGHGRDDTGHGGSGRGDDGRGSSGGHGDANDGPGRSGGAVDGGGSGSGSGGGDRSRSGGGSGDGSGGGSGSGSSGSGSGRSGSGNGSGSGHDSGTSGGGDSRDGSGSSISTSGGHGSDDATESVVGTETAATSTSGGSESSSSGSGTSGSSGGSGSSGDSSITSDDSLSSSGSSGGPSPSLDSTIVTDDGSGSGSGGGSGSSDGS